MMYVCVGLMGVVKQRRVTFSLIPTIFCFSMLFILVMSTSSLPSEKPLRTDIILEREERGRGERG